MNKWKKEIYYWYKQYGFECMSYYRAKQIQLACIGYDYFLVFKQIILDIREKETVSSTKCGW